MKITVKKNNKKILERTDAVIVTDKGGAYEVIYEDETGQTIFKDMAMAVIIELTE